MTLPKQPFEPDHLLPSPVLIGMKRAMAPSFAFLVPFMDNECPGRELHTSNLENSCRTGPGTGQVGCGKGLGCHFGPAALIYKQGGSLYEGLWR